MEAWKTSSIISRHTHTCITELCISVPDCALLVLSTDPSVVPADEAKTLTAASNQDIATDQYGTVPLNQNEKQLCHRDFLSEMH